MFLLFQIADPSDFNTFKDLPDEIALPIVIGTKVTGDIFLDYSYIFSFCRFDAAQWNSDVSIVASYLCKF